MYLKQTKTKNGRVYLSICESYYKDKVSKTRTVEKCGYLDELQARYNDPIAYYKARAEKLTKEASHKNAPVTVDFSPSESIDMRSETKKNLGHAVLSYYYHALGIDRFWNNRRMRGSFRYNPDAIFRYLVYTHVLNFGLETDESDKDQLIDRTDFTENDIFQSYSFISEYQEALIDWINKEIKEMRRRDYATVYQDLSHYYVRTETRNPRSPHKDEEEINVPPFISLRLNQDSDGIPFGYQITEGDPSFSLSQMNSHKPSQVMFIADREAPLSQEADDRSGLKPNKPQDTEYYYLFEKPLASLSPELREWVINQSEYLGGELLRFKDCIVPIETLDDHTVQNGQGGNTQVRVIVFWSEDRAIKEHNDRQAELLSVPSLASSQVTQLSENEQYDGYCCLISNDLSSSIKELLTIFFNHAETEDCYNSINSSLLMVPDSIPRQVQITVRFMFSYVALLILMLIRRDLKGEYSITEIAFTIASATGTLMKKNYYLFSYRSPLTDRLSKISGVDLSRKVLTTKELRDILADTKKTSS